MALILSKVLWVEAIFFSSEFMIATFRQEKNTDITWIGRAGGGGGVGVVCDYQITQLWWLTIAKEFKNSSLLIA